MKEKKQVDINKFLNSFFSYHQYKNNLLFGNLEIFLNMTNFIHSQIEDYIRCNNIKIDYYKVSPSSLLEEEKIIDSFYQSLDINFKLNNIIKDGTLEIRTKNLEDMNKNINKIEVRGNNTYQDGHKVINVYNSGLITDSIIWVHEISHYLNQPDNERNQTNNLFTEAIAFTYELIYLDYLKELGYNYESYIFKHSILENFYNITNIGYSLIGIYLLYDKLGEVSKENYKLYYGSDKYYRVSYNDSLDMISEDPDDIFTILWYTLAAPLSIYMYEEYKKNSKFNDNIKKLNDSINDKTVVECLNIIGLSNYDNESLNKIRESFKSYIKDLEKHFPNKKLIKK